MLLTLCGSCYKGVELGSHLLSEHYQALPNPLKKLQSSGVSVLKREDMKEIESLSIVIQGFGLLQLVTPLKHGQRVSASCWLSKGKLQSSCSISHNSDQQDYASVDMGGSAQEMDPSLKRTQLSFKF